MKKEKRSKFLTPQEEIELIRKKLGYRTYDQDVEVWLDTGSFDLNAALGSKKNGLAGGRLYELHGWESHGKSAIATKIAAMAQSKLGAHVGFGDIENAYKRSWVRRQNLDPDKVALFKPKMAIRLSDLKKGKLDKKFIQSAEDICTEMEEWAKWKHNQDPNTPIVLIVDSVTALLVDEENIAGLQNQNMRTGVALASFMSDLCKRWVQLAANYNWFVFFINQLREKPGVMYGSPEYTPGGKALKFYCSVRVKVRRVKDGRIKKNGKIIGLKCIVQNVKNKLGTEGQRAGFRANFAVGKWKFCSAEALEREAANKGEG